jgi:hypothetical protein
MQGDYSPSNRNRTSVAQLKAEAAALCFRSHQDALDFAAHGSKDMPRLFIGERLDITNRYVKGDIGCYLRLHSRFSDQECDLAFVSTGDALRTNDRPSVADDIASVDYARFFDFNRHQSAVFLGVTKLVEGPEGIVPSFVWIESAKQRDDLWRAMFADAPTINIVIELGKIVAERKAGPFGASPAACNSGGVSSLIENGAEIARDIEQDARQHLWRFLSEHNLMDVPARIRLCINDMGPWLAVDKLIDEHIEIVDVVLCANERKPRTVEQISHGKVRSDERP